MFALRPTSLASSRPRSITTMTTRTLFARRRNNRLNARRLQLQKGYRQPTLEQVAHMPRSPQEMDNQTIVALAAMGDTRANQELVKRHVMTQDRVSYEEATKVFEQIRMKNRENMALLAIPYHIGIATAVSAGFLAIPMVFDLGTAKWFNTDYVTMDVPPPEDLETMLETGNWTWNWMEPPLGTISFTLLALQFSRAQMQNLGIKPYTEAVKSWRGRRLAQAFPQYDANVLIQYSESTDIVH
ncbi:hypothetical protein FisN_37Hu044 [Fistulifera solaris]|uniref:Uncharacterized protein n=1 Tax=Fistulifera solaris TaxID=1519565 RepID=A0A1Z5KJH3_FISSO|nr:hypothetical protein FisN_37Hu044 [Fistulifera solaris]|eukprot:GAX26406.1 hypothetical protein FisN_37Hu044 [Fistulifera solaris]